MHCKNVLRLLACVFPLSAAIWFTGCGNSETVGTAEQTARSQAAQDSQQAVQSDAPVAAESKPAEPAARLSDEVFLFAAYEGQLENVRKAIAGGNNVNAIDPTKKLTALHMAAYNGHTEVVKLLLEHGATVDCRDDEGKTPLIHACTGPFAETVEVLLEAGADVNAQESTEAFTPLMMGAGLGQLDVVKVLLDHRADKTMRDNDGDMAIQHAQNSGHADIVKLLGP